MGGSGVCGLVAHGHVLHSVPLHILADLVELALIMDIAFPLRKKSSYKNKKPAELWEASGLKSVLLANRYAHLSTRGVWP